MAPSSSSQGHCYNSEESIMVGPWGGHSGEDFSFKTNGGIAEITIRYGEVIDSISFKTVNTNGKVQYSEKFGGNGGQSKKIVLDYPGEYLTEINGSHGNFLGRFVINSLCFITNRAKYGPFGWNRGTPFYYPLQGRAIVGFHGRFGEFVDAIGFYVKPKSSSFASCSCQELTTKVNNVMTLMNGDVPREAGPWGGSKGKSWDDGVFSGIQQVHVHEGNGVVSGIQIQYLTKDGKTIWSKRHGGDGGDKINRIKLDCESEYLVGMMGFYAPVVGNEGFEAVRSITFYSNKGKYGPFGDEIGTAFNSALSDGKIVGFHGRSGAFLDAIGVHMEYL